MSYVDLHLHLLPEVDDGARDLRESLSFSRRLVDEGVREVTVTPHVGAGLSYDPLSIPERVEQLQRALDREGVPLRVHPGGEVHPAGARSLSDAELEVVSHGPAGSRWLLVEVPFAGVDAEFIETCGHLRSRGYALLIAHPERAAGILPEGLELLRTEIEAGALLQVNVCSLLGNHGAEAQDAAHALVRDGRAFVLASDAHPGSREHTLRLGFELALRAGATSLQAWRLTQGNPRFLLEHGIPPAPRWLVAPLSPGADAHLRSGD
jgi:protein-tyrosine phosphatase